MSIFEYKFFEEVYTPFKEDVYIKTRDYSPEDGNFYLNEKSRLRSILKDTPITDDSIRSRLASRENDLRDSRRIWSPLPDEHFNTPLSQRKNPYKISKKLKSQLHDAVTAKSVVVPSFSRPIMKHLVTDIYRKEESDPILDELCESRLQTLKGDTEPVEDAPYSKLTTNDTGLEKYRDIIFKDVHFNDFLMTRKVKKLLTIREDDYTEWIGILNTNYEEYVKFLFSDVMNELKEKQWMPCDIDNRPIFRKGGRHFRKWTADCEKLLMDTSI